MSDLENASPILLMTHLNEIDLGKCLIIARLLDIENGNDVLVIEVAQKLHLSQGSQTEHGMIEGSNLLDGHFMAGGFVKGGAVTVYQPSSSWGSCGLHAHHTTPYAPSPTTSWISYCSETLKEIFLELPLPPAARDMVAACGGIYARLRWRCGQYWLGGDSETKAGAVRRARKLRGQELLSLFVSGTRGLGRAEAPNKGKEGWRGAFTLALA